MDEKNLTLVGKYTEKFNEILGIKLPCKGIYKSGGFENHVCKKHAHCVKYMDRIPEILAYPDYIGTNPKVSDSVEFVKRLEDNVLVAVKLDSKNNYLYTASMYAITDSKLEHRVFGGRLKKCVDKAA